MRHHTTLRYVDAIARHGSIRRAAEVLAITPSALNRRLLALEEELGVPLFERLARGVRLSAAGEAFVHHARRQMADMARVRAAIEDMKGARRGHVTIAFDRALPSAALSARIVAYRAEYPEVTFEVIACDRSDAAALLQSYTADIAVAVEPERTSTFATLAVVPVQMLALASKDHAIGNSEPVRLYRALEHPFALPSFGRSARFLFDLATARRDRRVEPVLAGPDSVILPLIRAGQAIGIGMSLPSAGDGREEWEHPALVGVRSLPFHPGDVPLAQVHVGQLRDRALPVPAARFADTILRAIARATGEV